MPNQGQQLFTPESVFNLIVNNPQAKTFVESLAKMNQMQQAVQQFVPPIQHFVQNPMAGLQAAGNWAQNAINQTPPPPTNPETQNTMPQQGGTPPVNNTLQMAMDIINKFEAMIKELHDGIQIVMDKLDKQATDVTSITESLAGVGKEQEKLGSELAAIKKDILKAIPANGSK